MNRWFIGPLCLLGRWAASEFLEYFLDLCEKQAKEQYRDPSLDLSRLFRFDTVSRTDAGPTIGVKYETTSGNKVLRLPIPTGKCEKSRLVDLV